MAPSLSSNQTSGSATLSLAPVRLSYVAALRGVAPRKAESAFSYAQVGCSNAEAFLCLAASNPEGMFYAVVGGDAEAISGRVMADRRHVTNATFTTNATALTGLDYLVYESTVAGGVSMAREEVAMLAEKTLKPGGLLAYRYKAYPNGDEALRFIVNEFAPEMSVEEAQEFLGEIKALGPLYFSEHPIAATALENALAKNVPDQFFMTCDNGEKVTSGTFETLVQMTPHGLSYVGDADIGNNYMELATPASAHDVLLSVRGNFLYESIKDFAMQRLERCDIWCRQPVEQIDNIVALYDPFTFGIAGGADQLPGQVTTRGGKTVDLSAAPFPALFSLMQTMPISIGDFLQHESGAMTSPEDAVGALQVLVALGIVAPMRSSYQGQKQADAAFPKWATGFNNYMNEASVDTPEVMLASPVVGGAVTVPARDALVIQAINRVGMQDSAAALMLELRRISQNPALASKIMDAAEPTPEIAVSMIHDVVNRSMVQWYAYGLLAA